MSHGEYYNILVETNLSREGGPDGPTQRSIMLMTRRPSSESPVVPVDADKCEPKSTPKFKGPLRPLELAEVAILVDLAVVLTFLSMVVPAIGGIVGAMAAAPHAALRVRHRTRVVVMAGIIAWVLGLVIGGQVLAGGTIGAWIAGLIVGGAIKRDWGSLRLMLLTVVTVVPIICAPIVALLLAIPSGRKLIGAQLDIAAKPINRFFKFFGWHGFMAAWRWSADHWILVFCSIMVAFFILIVFTAFAIARPVIRRITETLGPPLHRDVFEHGLPAPVPARLEGVTFSYPGAARPALSAVKLVISKSGLTALVGANGSGKSTLLRILSGLAPMGGTVSRPGAVGLGRDGGTAVIAQDPQTQVLGVLVADDVIWGIPDPATVDVEGLLAQVGLSGFERRETSTLSGGEQQRLAIAAALARRPGLLLADEVTAMVDPDGRVEVHDLLKRVGTSRAVVMVTHDDDERAGADKVVCLKGGRVVRWKAPPGARALPPAEGPRSGEPVLVLDRVGYVHGLGTPWERRALHDVSLAVQDGSAVLVAGHNGAGKTTLCRILSGLVEPTEGRVLLDSHPIADQLGSVGYAFQHARLQLVGRTVADTVLAGTKATWEEAAATLALVGLDPSFGPRSVQRLSGGEQRRVVLASLLLHDPRVLLLDEPMAGLDRPSRESLIETLADMRSAGHAIVIVSHDLHELRPLVDSTLVLDRGRLVPSEVTA